MEEKTLISSKRGNVRRNMCIILVIAGIVSFAMVWTGETSHGFYHDKIANGNWDYVLISMFPHFASMTIPPVGLCCDLVFPDIE